MKVSVPKEVAEGERRVALVPEVAKRLSPTGIELAVESGAGEAAHHPDGAYEEAGVSVSADGGFSGDVVAKVAPPTAEEISRMKEGGVLIGFLQPLTAGDTSKALADAGVTSFAMEAIPRITRAQSMDALSSQATVAGYRAGLIAAQELGRFFPMLTTCRRLGAVVQAFDVRAAVKEQIESLGARFLEIDLGLEDAEAEGGYARP